VPLKLTVKKSRSGDFIQQHLNHNKGGFWIKMDMTAVQPSVRFGGKKNFLGVTRNLEEQGFAYIRTSGSHYIYEGPNGNTVSVPYHSKNQQFSKELMGKIRRQVEQAGGDSSQLRFRGGRLDVMA
jgi:predicted RNA binding protein YcfA (HicA-like mRNA interferase family)